MIWKYLDFFSQMAQDLPNKNHQGTSEGRLDDEAFSQKAPYPFKKQIELIPTISEMFSIKPCLSWSLYNRELITEEKLLIIQGNRTLNTYLNIWCVICLLGFFHKKSSIIIAFS